MAAVDAEYWGKLGPLGALLLFAGGEAIWDDHAGGIGVVGCDCDDGADIVAAPPIASGAPLSVPLWPLGPFGGFIVV